MQKFFSIHRSIIGIPLNECKQKLCTAPVKIANGYNFGKLWVNFFLIFHYFILGYRYRQDVTPYYKRYAYLHSTNIVSACKV